MSHPKTYSHLLFIILLILITATSSAVWSAPDAVTITSPGASDVVFAELDDFATTVMGDPWDMNEPTDLFYYRDVSQIENGTFADGIYSGTLTNGAGGDRITLLSVLARNNAALRTGKNGYAFPIDTDRYRYLTMRLFKSNSQINSGTFLYYKDDSLSAAVQGTGPTYSTPTSAGWFTVVVDMEASSNWSGEVRDFIVKPFAGTGAAGATMKLDYVRLTAEDPLAERPFTIEWSGGSGDVTLYASLGDKTLDENDYQILTVPASDGEHTFQTGVLPAGTYYIAAQEGGSTSWSEGAIVINDVPNFTITKPSMTSGEEYSASVIGNEWDMNDVTDVNFDLKPWENTCTNGGQFNAGIYSANFIANCNSTFIDPIVFLGGLNSDPDNNAQDMLIDTDKYRYLSYRYHLDAGEQNVGQGWVSRFGWWQTNRTDNITTQEIVMSRDVIVFEGWNTYNLDLWANDIVDEAHPVQRSWLASAPNRLRFDPAELNSNLLPASFEIDWFKLTAMDEVNGGSPFSIEYEPNEEGATYTFYYDSDTNPDNGHNLIGSTARPATNAPAGTLGGSNLIYLPALFSDFAQCTATGCYAWATSGVPAGEYYVCIEADDGLNTAYRCSEAPMIVR